MSFLVSYFSQVEDHIVVFVENFFQHMAIKWAQTNHLWNPGSDGRAYVLARSDVDKAKTSWVAINKADLYFFLNKSVDAAGKVLKEKDTIFRVKNS